MKRLLLLLFVASASFVDAQRVVLNEIYSDPGNGRNEFLELYNSDFTSFNTNGITVVTYYSIGTRQNPDNGVYVLDLPDGQIASSGYYVVGSALNLVTQAGSATANANWNNLPASGYLKKYMVNGATFTDATDQIPANFNDLFNNAGSDANYYVLVYSNGVLVNTFFGGRSSKTIPPDFLALPTLNITLVGGSVPSFSVNFSSIVDAKGEFVTPTPGSDNGYIRLNDGQCGTWDKASAQKNHTPGVTNGATTNLGSITANASLFAPPAGTTINVTYSATYTGTNSSFVFPMTVRVIEDFGSEDNNLNDYLDQAKIPDSVLSSSDAAVGNYGPYPAAFNNTVIYTPQYTDGAYQPQYTGWKKTRGFFVAFETPQGCLDQLRYASPQRAQALPVSFKSFTAKRNKQNVLLSWQTATEQNNAGFAIERNINGNWTEIAFVPSQANGGNSSSELSYVYNDLNNHKGISQYRIRQNDLDAKTSYSVIRSVQGEGTGPKLVIYPNPSVDGRVQLVFEDANSARHIVISDMSGRIVRQLSNVLNSSMSIDGLTNGLYTARVINQATGESTLQKFVIQQK